MNKAVTIVVPVYGDWPSLNDCIESLKIHTDPNLVSIILANDCGPEWQEIEKNIKVAIKGLSNFKYVKNPENLGFIGNCNRAVLEVDQTENDILLLNSDTKVTAGFLDSMLKVLYSSSNVGAVSPRSNNATIATIPLTAIHQKGIEPEKSYELFLKLKNKLPEMYEIPSAHGFCMLIKREVIIKYGLFDTVFGKGYGEEVDFCMRIKQQGYSCMLSNWAYVYHLEARSFSLETKSKLLEENNKIIWERYPHYRDSVRTYVADALEREGALERSVGYTVENSTNKSLSPARRFLKKYPRLQSAVRTIRRSLNIT